MTRLTWLGHSTVVLDIGGQRLLTDPVLDDRIGPVTRRSQRAEIDVDSIDAVLVSHLHHDHLHLPSLGRLRDDIASIVPRGAGPLLRSEGFATWWSSTFPRRQLSAPWLCARYQRCMTVGGTHSGLPAPALGFLIEGEHRIYFPATPTCSRAWPNWDSASTWRSYLSGVGGPRSAAGTSRPVRAATALTLLQPRMAVAIHWGTLWPWDWAGFGGTVSRNRRAGSRGGADDRAVVSLSSS